MMMMMVKSLSLRNGSLASFLDAGGGGQWPLDH